MVIMRLEVDNFYDFNEFLIDFSYPKKIVKNPLEKEYLRDFPNFRYRRFNIIIGANSSGKTTFGLLLRNIFVLLNKKEITLLEDSIANKQKSSYFKIDFVVNNILYKVECYLPQNLNDTNRSEIQMSIRQTKLLKDDTYEKALKRIDKIKENKQYYVDSLQNSIVMGWNFSFPENTFVKYNFSKEDENSYSKLLEQILKFLDPSIVKVEKSTQMDKCFYIFYKDSSDPLVVENNRPLASINYMSSGTKFAFNLADVIWGLKKDLYGFYYLDEQFSFIHSEIELALIAHLSGYSKNDDQIILTTHNSEVLGMDFPVHTFGFFKKYVLEGEEDKIRYLNASALEKRNSASIINHYKNDAFGVLPDLSEIYRLGDL